MKQHHKSILFLFCILIFTASTAYADSKKVLLFHSYHVGYKWSDDITSAVQKTFRNNESETGKIGLYVEFLDTKRYSSQHYRNSLFTFLKEKYKDLSFDAILCSDNNALNFLLIHREWLFPDIPIIFCGINNFHPSLLRGEKNITGVNETVDSEQTIELMRSIHPDTKRIVVVSDDSPTGMILLQDIIKQSRLHSDIEWVFPSANNRQELLTTLANLSKNDLVYYNIYLQDDIGHLEYDSSATLISSHSPVPVYGSIGFFLGYGLVGGYMTNAAYQGENAAKQVLKILAGIPVDNIPVIMESPNQYTADYSVMQKFSIGRDSFPPLTRFINDPPDFYEQHKIAIWIVCSSLILLSLLSIALSFNVLRKNHAEKKLMQLTQELESRVKERTAQLQDAFHEIHEKEEKLNHLLSNLRGMVYRCLNDGNWTMLYLSEGTTQLTGYEPDDFIIHKAISFSDIIHDEDAPLVQKAVEKAIKNKKPFAIEYRIITRSKEVRWVWEQGLVVFDSEGNVSYLDGIISDITDDKIARLEQQKLATAVQQTDDLIFITNNFGIIEYVNPAFEQVTQYHFSEVQGKNPRILKSGKQDAAVYKNMWATINDGQVYRGRFVNKRKNGDEYIAEVTISPILNEYNEITHFVSVQRDITQEIALEKDLRQAQKLEALGTLSEGIAHEINTPAQFVSSNLLFANESIADISSFLEELTTIIAGEKKEELEDLKEKHDIDYLLEEVPLSLQQSSEGIDRISQIVLSMKLFANPGNESIASANLNEAIQSTVVVCSSEWNHVADIVYNLQSDLPFVPCHLSDINQVFLNVIVNAAHALKSSGYGANSKQKGTIWVTTTHLDDFVQIRIRDNASGIPKEIQQRIFDPFFTTKAPGEGTGQGLSVAYSIITEKHGGRLYFETSEEGTTFFIELPASDS